MEEGGFAASGVKHCVRPVDMTGQLLCIAAFSCVQTFLQFFDSSRLYASSHLHAFALCRTLLHYACIKMAKVTACGSSAESYGYSNVSPCMAEPQLPWQKLNGHVLDHLHLQSCWPTQAA